MRLPRPKPDHNVTPEPWALLYEGVVAYVMKHREEYGLDIADNPMLCQGVASILRGLEVLLDGEVGGLEPGRCWQNLDSFARFAGWSEGLEGAAGLDDIRKASLLQRSALQLFDGIEETSRDLSKWTQLERSGQQIEDTGQEVERDTQSFPLFPANADQQPQRTKSSPFSPVSPSRSRVLSRKSPNLSEREDLVAAADAAEENRQLRAARSG